MYSGKQNSLKSLNKKEGLSDFLLLVSCKNTDSKKNESFDSNCPITMLLTIKIHKKFVKCIL